MNFLPFEKLNFESPLSKGEIENSIKNNIALNTELGLTFSKNSIKEYEGFVDNNKFKFRRILKSGINSFIPIVSGKIEQKDNGCQVELKLRLHKVIMIFAIVMTIFSGSLLIIPLFNKPLENVHITELLNDKLLNETLNKEQYNDLSNITTQKETDWSGLLLLFSPYLMCTIFFNYEAKITKEKLKIIFKTNNNIC